jgi:hypothetical protein
VSDPFPPDVLELLAFGDVEPAVDLEEFFDPAFMREHTEFESFAAFCAESPWEVEERADLEDVPVDELDGYVAETTAFDSWVAMRNEAAERAVVERLML